jgi:restriction system-associated AAA family ATPase
VKLTRVHIIKAEACGGLLNDLDLVLRTPPGRPEHFDPLCLVGANGTGKSQFLQVIAEAFQVVFHACVPEEERPPKEERVERNKELEFVIEYAIRPTPDREPVLIRLSRRSEGRRRPVLKIERNDGIGWDKCEIMAPGTRTLLPARVIGYTSGDNETLSLPFLISRSGYAKDVRERALSLDPVERAKSIPDTRLMLIDYATHIEILVANLILGGEKERAELLKGAKLGELQSFRCIVQLEDGEVAGLSSTDASGEQRKGVQLTDELQQSVERLRNCSTCYNYDKGERTYTLDFLVTDQTRKAFRGYWHSAIELYSALHKLSMLNDLAIPKRSRERLQHDIKTRRFASRLPEPQDEDRVFRFEQVRFAPKQLGDRDVDYVSLSDGEHQLAQILGTMCMLSDANILFLLDEPESHFNPRWRVKFISRLLDLPTAQGKRIDPGSAPAQQDCLMTTHAPFVPSDMSKEKVLIFMRDEERAEQGARVRVQHPGTQTYGAAFDAILQECFDVRPPSDGSRAEIDRLMKSNDPDEIRAGLARLGDSVDKVFLMDRRRRLLKEQGK